VQSPRSPLWLTSGLPTSKTQAITHTPNFEPVTGLVLIRLIPKLIQVCLLCRAAAASPLRGAVHLREALANLEQAESIVVCA